MLRFWICALCLMVVLEGRCESIAATRQNLDTNCCNYVLYTDDVLTNLVHSLSQNAKKVILPFDSLDEDGLVWCAEHACAILGLESSAELLRDFSQTTGVRDFIVNPRRMSNTNVAIIKEAFGKEVSRKDRERKRKIDREKRDIGIRVSEFNSLLKTELIGPFHFTQLSNEEILVYVFGKVNGHLKKIDAEFSLGYSCEVGGCYMKSYTFDVPRMPIADMFDFLAAKISNTVTNMNGFYVFREKSDYGTNHEHP